MTGCDQCDIARMDPLAIVYRSGCIDCHARSLAHSQPYFESSRANAMTPAYRRALDRVFGNDWEAGHAKVNGFAALIAGTKGRR